MTDRHYFLEPYKGPTTRHLCPQCRAKGKTFARYVSSETGEYLQEDVGRCNREEKCGYHYPPKQFFIDNNISLDTPASRPRTPRLNKSQLPPTSFIPADIFRASLNTASLERNHFISFLADRFGEEAASSAVANYFIGTSNHWAGATVFWQVDQSGKIRTGKIMLYNAYTGKRVKEPYSHITWAHKCLKSPNFGLKQCLFGEHLLIDTASPVAVVESEKTACIASLYFPNLIWLACGGIASLSAKRCQPLKGRKVVLFPDLNAFDKWAAKAKELSSVADFSVSDLLESKATDEEKKQGLDLADYLLRFDPRQFQSPTACLPALPLPPLAPPNNPQMEAKIIDIIPPQPPVKWDLDALEAELRTKAFTAPVQLTPWERITDVNKFIDSHLSICRANNGNKTFLPYYDRLAEINLKT